MQDEGEEGDRGLALFLLGPGGRQGPMFPQGHGSCAAPSHSPFSGPQGSTRVLHHLSPLFISVPTNPLHYPGVTVGVRHLGCLLP